MTPLAIRTDGKTHDFPLSSLYTPIVRSTLSDLLSAKKNGLRPNIGSMGVGATSFQSLETVFC